MLVIRRAYIRGGLYSGERAYILDFTVCYIPIFRGFKKLICLLIRVTTDFMNI